MNDKYTPKEREAATRIGTTPEDLDLAFAGHQAKHGLDPFAGMAGNPSPFEPDIPQVVTKGDLDQLITAYADARNAREQADEVAKELHATENVLEAALFDALERLNLRNVRHARGLFSLNDLAWASVTDETKVREWALNEAPELLLPNASRLAMIVRQALKGERDAMPPGVEPRFSRKIGWRRS